MSQSNIKLTEYSHGAGCGCKISPQILSTILASRLPVFEDPDLLVGNHTLDDAAVYKLNDTTAIISTTDFFMPIVDDPFTFGRIAAANAISDIYAMGGTPMMAIAILGWPVSILPAEVAQQVVDGGRRTCADAGIVLAGGHSIDSLEPIFGLAVSGKVPLNELKRNDTAHSGDKLYLTKPLGIGILTTAQKQKKLEPNDANIAVEVMCQLNLLGPCIAALSGVNAMTDVTGFGLAGHLIEMCQGAKLSAVIQVSALPLLPQTRKYLAMACVPGGTQRNYESYGEHLSQLDDAHKAIICDPQTSGGLLIAVSPAAEDELTALCKQHDVPTHCIGHLTSESQSHLVNLG
jgi:selenide,water dikinase|tara:strand:- start:692 stop:1732 length:1041 start_codon:yes stop_codon:yes gene_type:complete